MRLYFNWKFIIWLPITKIIFLNSPIHYIIILVLLYSTDLCSINKEAVYDVDCDTVIHDREEESEEPAKRDHGHDLKLVLEQGVEFRQVLLSQPLKHN